MSLPTVTVIVPHYNDVRGLEACLTALTRQTYPAELVQLVVADNNSNVPVTALRDVIAERAELVTVVERGAGPARNGGVEVATGQVFAFTDSDCVPHERWLESGVNALGSWDFIGGRVVVFVDDVEKMSDVEAFERVFAFDFKTYIEKKGFTGAGNLFCSREVFEAVGGFRAEVSEDVEWSRRARRLGFRLGYAPDAVVAHPARRSWEELWRKWDRVNNETFKLYREQRLGRLRWTLRALALPLSVVAHLPKIVLSDQLRSPAQRSAAMKILLRIRMARMKHALSLVMKRNEK